MNPTSRPPRTKRRSLRAEAARIATARRLAFLVPGDLQGATGGYGYDRRIIAGLRTRGWSVQVCPLDASFPHPTAAALEAAHATLHALPDGELVVIDGLALGAMPDVLAQHAARVHVVALVHHPLAAETGLQPALRDALRESERRALAHVRRVIATSPATAAALDSYGVPSSRRAVVLPGTDVPQSLPAKSPPGARGVRLLCVATLIPRKGHALLIEALASLRGLQWSLRCVGGRRDAATTTLLQRAADDAGLGERIVFTGDVDAAAVRSELAAADLFVLPTLYEGFGMAVAEALAHGLPVISTRTGGIADMVPADAGILTEPGDGLALRAALDDVLRNPARLAAFAQGAQRARSALPSWDHSAAAFEQELLHALTVDASRDAGFSASWLELREPVDAKARSSSLLAMLQAELARHERTALRVIDLGTGLASNLRHLAPHLDALGFVQHWQLVDHDARLLRELPARLAADPVTRDLLQRARLHCEPMQCDLAIELPSLEGVHLVGGAALLDLVAAGWLERLAAACRGARVAVFFALSFDGRIDLWPALHDDHWLREQVNAHQRSDKGFGAALGPDAVIRAARAFVTHGFRVQLAPSPWLLAAQDAALQSQLVEGWANAARELVPQEALRIQAWRALRLQCIARGESRMRVGHHDLLAIPAA